MRIFPKSHADRVGKFLTGSETTAAALKDLIDSGLIITALATAPQPTALVVGSVAVGVKALASLWRQIRERPTEGEQRIEDQFASYEILLCQRAFAEAVVEVLGSLAPHLKESDIKSVAEEPDDARTNFTFDNERVVDLRTGKAPILSDYLSRFEKLVAGLDLAPSLKREILQNTTRIAEAKLALLIDDSNPASVALRNRIETAERTNERMAGSLSKIGPSDKGEAATTAVAGMAQESQRLLFSSHLLQASAAIPGTPEAIVARLEAQVRAVRSILLEVPQRADSQSSDPLLSFFSGKHTEARELLNGGEISQAKTKLVELQKDLNQQSDTTGRNELLAKVCLNLGLAHYYSAELTSAAEWTERGIALFPEHPRVEFNRAFADYLRGNSESAERRFRALLSSADNSSDAGRVLVVMLMRMGRSEEARQLLPKNPEKTPDMLLCAELLCDGGNYTTAIDILRKVVAAEPENHSACSQLAFALGAPLLERKCREKLAAYALTRAEEEQLREAARLSAQALEMARNRGHRLGLLDLHRNASAFAAASRQYDDSVRIAVAGLALEPCDQSLLDNLFLSYYHLGHLAEAEKVSAKLADIDSTCIGLAKHLVVLCQRERFSAAVEAVEQRIKKDESVRSLPHIMAEYIRATAGQRGPGAARELFSTMRPDVQNQPEVIVALAQVMLRVDKDQAREFFLKAETAARGTAHERFVVLQVGEFFYKIRNWREAMVRLLLPGQVPAMSIYAGEYLHCLFEIRDFPATIELGQALIAERWTPQCAEILGLSYLSLENIPAARDHFERLVREVPSAMAIRRLASVLVRLADVTGARGILLRGHDQFPTDGALVADLSRVCFLGRDFRRAAEYAVKASRLSPKSPEAEAALVQLIIAPSSELPGLSPRDRKRIGKALAKAKGMRRIEFRTENGIPDLSPLIEMLKERRLHVEHVFDLYRAQPLPLLFVARAIGSRPFETWTNLTNGAIERLWFSQGSHEEQYTGIAALSAARRVCVDVMALFTLEALDGLELLTQAFDEVLVPFAVFEVIREEHDALGVIGDTGALIYNEGRVLFTEKKPDDTRASKERLGKIIRWVQLNSAGGRVSLVGVTPGKPSVIQPARIRRHIPVELSRPIQTARDENVPLLTDDLGTRHLAKQSEVSTANTQSLLQLAETRGLWTRESKDLAILALLDLRYSYVSLGLSTIETCFTSRSLLCSPTYLRVLAELGRSSHPNAAATLGAGFAWGWLDATGPNGPGKDVWVERHLEELFRNQDDRLAGLAAFAIALATASLRWPDLAAASYRGVMACALVQAQERSALARFFRPLAIAMASHIGSMFPHMVHTRRAWETRGALMFFE